MENSIDKIGVKVTEINEPKESVGGDILDQEKAKSIIESQGLLRSGIDFEAEERWEALQGKRSNTQLISKEWNDIIKMRKCWSYWLLGIIATITFFDFSVVVCVGFGWMNFERNYIIPFFIGESFLKTIGLAVIVVGFLFNKEGVWKLSMFKEEIKRIKKEN